MFGSWNPSQFLLQSASGLIKKATGFSGLQGILCATSNTAIIVVWDSSGTNTANATGDPSIPVQVTGQITLVAGQSYPIPAKINKGIYVQLVSGSGTWTTFFD